MRNIHSTGFPGNSPSCRISDAPVGGQPLLSDYSARRGDLAAPCLHPLEFVLTDH